MAKVPTFKKTSAPPADDMAADANNEAMKDPKSLAGKRSSENDPTNYMNITVKREKLETAEQQKNTEKECEFMIIDGKAENLYSPEEIIEIEQSDEEEQMDVETEKRMMAKFHKHKESSIQLMGTHWYVKDGKGGVVPTALAKPGKVYVKKFWDAELKKREKKVSSKATTGKKSTTRAPKVTPLKAPKPSTKKVGFSQVSQIKTRSKSTSPRNRGVVKLNEEEWPTLEEASPKSKRKPSPPNPTKSIRRDTTPTEQNPITIDKRAATVPNNSEGTPNPSPKANRTPSPPTKINQNRNASPTPDNPITIDHRAAKPAETNKETNNTSSDMVVDRSKPILEQVKPATKFQSSQKERTETYLEASNKEYKKVTKKVMRRLNIAFDVEIKIAGPEDGARQEQALRTAIMELLQEAQNVDNTFGLMAWRDTKALPTIFSAAGIQKEPYNVLTNYLRPPMRGRSLQSIQTGRNFKWRVKATFDMDQETLLKTWSRMDSRRFFVTDFPVQAENCWQVGFCMGSTEGQVVTRINAELETVTGIKGIKASWQNVWQKDVTPSLWKEAKKKATDQSGVINNSVKHQWSPSALVIFVTRREDLKPARKVLYEKFGRNVTDSYGNQDAYPTWPSGAQMKFVPMADRNMSKDNVTKIGNRIKMHTTMKGNQVTFETNIKDPDMTLECLKGQTVGEAILGIMTPDNKNPLFRHFKHDWYRDIYKTTYSLVAHKAFEEQANQCAMTLANVLNDTYGDEVLKAFSTGMRGLNNPHKTYSKDAEDSDFEIDLESDDVDKFMNNTVECTFSNLEIIDQTTSEKETDQPFTGDNSTIEMGASMAYTHFSDKTQNTNKHGTTEQTANTQDANNQGTQEQTSTQSQSTVGVVSESSAAVDSSSISSITMNSGATQDIIKEAAKKSPNIQNALASGLFDVNDISTFFTEIFQQMIPPPNHPGGAEASEAGNEP